MRNAEIASWLNRGEFPDVTLIKPVNQVIKTERIRELVGQFSQAGIESQQQVFIIEQAEKMHPNAANSLLKVQKPAWLANFSASDRDWLNWAKRVAFFLTSPICSKSKMSFSSCFLKWKIWVRLRIVGKIFSSSLVKKKI